MSMTEFHARIARLDTVRASRTEDPEYRLPRAENARERLDFAMIRLRRAGIYGRHAYWSVFEGLAFLGLYIRPFHFWWPPALFVFFLSLIAGICGGLLVFIETFTRLPRMIGRLPDYTVESVITVGVCLAAAATWVHMRQAREANLPRWRDL